MEKLSKDEYLSKLYRIDSLLENVEEYVLAHQQINFLEFDYSISRKLTLFTLDPGFDFFSLEETSKKIHESLSSIKRIFSKPIINLKDTDDILPVESVHLINQKTIVHLASHSENVENIKNNSITPKKLLTRIYDDDYSIYENVVFCNFIDATLQYIRFNMNALRDFIYASYTLELNILERANHRSYFMALGKLQAGYLKDFDKYYSVAKLLFNRCKAIIKTIEPRLIMPVYRHNKIRNRSLAIRRTNIFLMQKDYHKVYNTYRLLNKHKADDIDFTEDIDIEAIKANYFHYLECLILYSLECFNFETDIHRNFNLMSLDIDFTFKSFGVNIKGNSKKQIFISIRKDKSYNILLLPSVASERIDLSSYKHTNGIDDCVVCTPFEDYQYDDSIFLSVDSIESFRKIQQLVLRGMIYADSEKKVCPFCGGRLIHNSENDSIECDSCHLIIKEDVCPECNEAYFYTTLSNTSNKFVNKSDFDHGDEWLYYRKIEGLFFYRNITKIDNRGRIICPYCKKVHR